MRLCAGVPPSNLRRELAPITFYLKAYTSTWKKWADDIHRRSKTLKDTIAKTDGWHLFWTSYQSPPKSVNDGSAVEGAHRDDKAEAERLQKLAKPLQSAKDKAQKERDEAIVGEALQPATAGRRGGAVQDLEELPLALALAAPRVWVTS